MISDSVNIDDTAVTPGTYGDATNSPQITIGADGRITAAVDVPISGGSGGGGLVWLARRTASNSADLQFTSLIDSTYDNYLFRFTTLVPATDGNTLHFRFSSNNGSSWDTGSVYRWCRRFMNQSSFNNNDGASANTSLNAIGTLSNAASLGGLTGRLELFNPLDTVGFKNMLAEISFRSTDTNNYRMDIGGTYLSTSAINAIQFYMLTGNITSGTIDMYGYAKT
jgi:hypothetical protein